LDIDFDKLYVEGSGRVGKMREIFGGLKIKG